MAKKAIPFEYITFEQMNPGHSYRVRLSFGTFSISAKFIKTHIYYHAYKRVGGKIHTTYVGKNGEITKEVLYKALVRLKSRYEGFGRDYIGHE